MNLLKQIALALIQCRHFQAALAELGRLSDRELSDRDLARDDIVRAAFEEAERRTEAAFARRRPRGHASGGDGVGGAVLGKAEVVGSGRPAR